MSDRRSFNREDLDRRAHAIAAEHHAQKTSRARVLIRSVKWDLVFVCDKKHTFGEGCNAARVAFRVFYRITGGFECVVERDMSTYE